MIFRRIPPLIALASASLLGFGCAGSAPAPPSEAASPAASTAPTSASPAAGVSRANLQPIGARPVQPRQDVD